MSDPSRMLFGPLRVELNCEDVRLARHLAPIMGAYQSYPSDAEPDLSLRLCATAANAGIQQPLRGTHWDYEDGFASRFGHFFVARWRLTPKPTVHAAIVRSPLTWIRPLLDYEFHTAHRDIAKMLHEHVLAPSVPYLFSDKLAILHAATMVGPSGKAVAVTGAGGVGKTSLALELGTRRGWGFVSDDMVVLDTDGTVYLNANWPKIYAYNVAGDAALTSRLLSGRSVVDRLHWRLKARRPHRVRRSIDPVDLYGRTYGSARLGYAVYVARDSVDDLCLEPMTADALARSMADVLTHEFRRFGAQAAEHDAHRRATGMAEVAAPWDPDRWIGSLEAGLRQATLHMLRVPHQMDVFTYRRDAADAIEALESGPA